MMTRVAVLTALLVAPSISLAQDASKSEFRGIPCDAEKFQAVLHDAKLQAPLSQKAISAGKFAGRSEPYFFLSDSQHLIFTIDGKGRRSELRQMREWKTSTQDPQKLVCRVRLPLPTDPDMEQFTFMQIHDSSKKLNKPLLRLAWIKSRKRVHDHLWAIVRNSTKTKSRYTYIDLDHRPDEFFDSEITVQDNRMWVRINGKTRVETDVTYWNPWSNYFKAGVYNQTEGTATAEFDTLRFESIQPE